MIDFDNEGRLRALRSARFATAILATTLSIVTIKMAFDLAGMFGFVRLPFRLFRDPWFRFTESTIVDVFCLIGYYLLLKSSADPAWRRISSLLVLMGIADFALWTVEYRTQLAILLGLRTIHPDLKYEWLRFHLGVGLGWFELLWVCRLAWSLSAHVRSLDPDRINEKIVKSSYQNDWFNELDERSAAHYAIPISAESARAVAATGIGVGIITWAVFLAISTDFTAWPPHLLVLGRRQASLIFLLYMIFQLAWLATIFQTTIICFQASRFSADAARRLNRDRNDHDLLRSRSEDSHHNLV